MIYIDDYLNNMENIPFEKSEFDNSIKFLEDGKYILNYKINIELINNSRTTSSGFIRKYENNNFNIINNTISYGYHRMKNNGHDSLISSSILDFKKNDIIKLSVKRVSGNGYLKTIPHETYINILKIE